jgi:photosystem II stability/assembly factor-like uncharacterized protein
MKVLWNALILFSLFLPLALASRPRACAVRIVAAALLCMVTFSIAPASLNAAGKLPEDMFSVSFPTEQDGWACGRWGVILHTADGGATWAHQESGTDFMLVSIHFVDAQHGHAVGEEGVILSTDDGGRNWKKQSCPVNYFLMGVHFATASTGWIVGERTHILYTENSGETWQVQFSDQDFILKSVSFCDEMNGWAAGEYGFVYHTSDGGKNWERQSGYFTISPETDEVEGGNYLFDVVAVDPRTAWAVGIDTYIMKTTDAGRTWQEIKTGLPKTPLFCVEASGTDHVFIGGTGLFIESADGGLNWKQPEFEPPMVYGWLYGLDKIGTSRFVAVGWEGAIYLNASDKWRRASY